jgi:hypothetical protein
MLRRRVVLPVPGGPNILNTFLVLSIDLPDALFAYLVKFTHGGFCHKFFVDQSNDLGVSFA